MNRLLLVLISGLIALPMLGAQELPVGTLPDGPRGGPVEVIHALLVQAQMIEEGQIMFCFPRGEEVPSLITKVDGKTVRAVDAKLAPLDIDDLDQRLPGYTSVLVVQAEYELDPFFTKLLNEQSVVFFLPKKMFAEMAKASKLRRTPGVPAP
jgi:hypothetical protein